MSDVIGIIFYLDFCSFIGFKFDDTDFKAAVKGINSNIKIAGRGDTTRTKALPDEFLDSLHRMLANLQNVMKYRNESQLGSYQEALNLLPNEYKNTYHILLVLGAQYIVTTYDIRRGREGIEFLTKKHFQVAEENGFKFYKKVR